MGKAEKAWQKMAAQQQQAQAAHIAQLQATCRPGEKLLTCPTCGHIGKFPEVQQMVSCITPNSSTSPHIGEIRR